MQRNKEFLKRPNFFRNFFIKVIHTYPHFEIVIINVSLPKNTHNEKTTSNFNHFNGSHWSKRTKQI